MELFDNKMIFVTGASRSGTTMLNRILGRHSQIFSLNELHVFGDLIKADCMTELLSEEQQEGLARKIIQRQNFGIFNANKQLDRDSILPAVIEQLAKEGGTAGDVFRVCMSAFAKQSGKTIACEQTPRNIFYAQQLLSTYPQAQVVHIVRDPRSVLASQKGKWRRKFLGGDNIPWLEVVRMWCNYHPATLSKLWVRANQHAIQLRSHKRIHTVRFESLLNAPADTLAELCQGLGIPYQDEMLNVAHVGSSHQQNESETRGISNATIDSWKDSLSAAEINMSQSLCAPVMKLYDYENVSISPSFIDSLLIWIRFPLHLLGVVLFNPQRAKIQIVSMFKASK